MRIAKNCQIERVTSADEAREHLWYPHLEGPRLVACNGVALAVVPVVRAQDDEPDTDGPIPVEALRAARRVAKGGEAEVRLNSVVRVPGTGLIFERPKDITFFEWRRVVPTDAPTFTIGLDARLLYDLARAIGAEERGRAIVRIEFTAPDRAFRVTAGAPFRGPDETEAPFGVMMPAKV